MYVVHVFMYVHARMHVLHIDTSARMLRQIHTNAYKHIPTYEHTCILHTHTRVEPGKSPAPQSTPRYHSMERSAHASSPSAHSADIKRTGSARSAPKDSKMSDDERDRRESGSCDDMYEGEVHKLKTVRYRCSLGPCVHACMCLYVYISMRVCKCVCMYLCTYL
jgi:hypothetical protein